MGTPNGTRASVEEIAQMKAVLEERDYDLGASVWHDWCHSVIPIARAIKPATFLNVGHGFGTKILLNEPSIGHITTLESDPRWVEAFPSEDEDRHEVFCASPQGEANWIMETDERTWDMALIDGMNGQRVACLLFLMHREKSPIIAVHDAETRQNGLDWIKIHKDYSVVFAGPAAGRSGAMTALYIHEKFKDRVFESLKGPR